MPSFLLMSTLAAMLACGPKTGPVPNISEAGADALRVPSVEEFQLGPGDRIQITVWQHSDLDMDVRIAPDGTISFPLLGTVELAGRTYGEIRDLLTESIATYYKDPQVAVNIVELQSQKVLVLGEVSAPGVLQLSQEMSVLEALTRTGGINQYSRTNNVLLVRGGLEEPALYTIDVQSIFAEGRMDQMVYLQQGDIVVVPTRTITNASRFFREVSGVLAPFVAGSAIYRNAVTGGAQGTSSVLD